ncbi:MAG TPA: hypothetical protein VK817_08035 [Trebonia sp.]|nr:hypothetical protein [Trebonia sp.]
MWDFFTPEERKRIGDAVDSAPSIFDERPWFLRIVADDRVELHLDYPDQDLSLLPRDVAISCGAALYNLRLAIRVAGHAVSEWLVPDLGRDSTLLASVEITTSRTQPPTDAEQELYEAIAYRHSGEEPYLLLPVPEPMLVEMEDAAAHEDGWLRAVHAKDARRLLRATAQAEKANADRPPADRQPDPGADARVARFESARRRLDPQQAALFEGVRNVQLMALSTDDDRPLDWVRAGRGLQHALLTATRFSMSAPYGRSARYSAPRQLGLPARRAPIRTSHQVPARYGVATAVLTGLLDLEDLRGTPRRWPWRSYYPEIPQVVFRVGYVAVEQAPPRVARPLRWEDRRENPDGHESPPEGARADGERGVENA